MATKRYVVFDRDGTLIHERHYLSDPAQVELIPGTAAGLKVLSKLDFGLIVATNQSGVGRGYFSEDRLTQIHSRLINLLAQEEIYLDGIFYCPHTPQDHCNCRKPKPGLLLQAAQNFQFNPTQCVVVGDKACDIQLGKSVGATTILVKTGYGSVANRSTNVKPDYFVDTAKDAALTIQQHFKD